MSRLAERVRETRVCRKVFVIAVFHFFRERRVEVALPGGRGVVLGFCMYIYIVITCSWLLRLTHCSISGCGKEKGKAGRVTRGSWWKLSRAVWAFDHPEQEPPALASVRSFS